MKEAANQGGLFTFDDFKFLVLASLMFDRTLVAVRLIRLGASNPHGPPKTGTKWTVHGLGRIEYIKP